jgi:hypothetical protein
MRPPCRLLLVGAFLALVAFAPLRAQEALRAVIDREITVAWQAEKVSATARSSDAEFLRRIYLDLVGTVPTFSEAATFLDDSAADKRARLIERLLADPRFARHQADLWDVILFSRNPPGSEADRRDGIQKWLTKQFADNVPYDQWVQALLKAEGNSVDEGAPLYLVQYRNRPEDASEAISQTFLGVQLQCARCHDHPYEPWTQLDFYGMAAFLARLDVVNVGKEKDLNKYAIGEKSVGDILFTGPVTEQVAGKKGEPVKPKFLAAAALEEPEMPADFKQPKFEENKPPPKPMFSRKDQLAQWIATRDNPYFARAIANRLWAQFLGRGLVHPVDNMSASNKPSHPALLEKLAEELVAHQFDVKWFVRELVSNETYQLSSSGGGADPAPLWFQYARTRPLSAEELADGWKGATWYEEVEKQQSKKEESRNRFHPLERDYVIRFFGTPNSGAGDFQGGLQEHLYLNNSHWGNLLNPSKGSLVEWLTKSKDEPLEARIERLYLSALSRRPTTEETERVKAFVAADGNDPRWSDVVWALLSSSEFRFNH